METEAVVRWDRGSRVVVRSRPNGDVGYTFPAIVVSDTAKLIALFQTPGTVCKRRRGPRGGPIERTLLTWDGSYEDVVFQRSTVHLHVPGDPFWVVRTWNGTEYSGWYVNLAAPWRRTAIGFDTLDHILHIEIAEDLSDWWWKDEAELAREVEQGRLSAEAADAVRQDGYEAIDRMNARTAPFGGDWSMMGRPRNGRSLPCRPDGTGSTLSTRLDVIQSR